MEHKGKEAKNRKLEVMDCRLLHSNRWGTQSARLFVSRTSDVHVDATREGFWPPLIRCRRWEHVPPSANRDVSSPTSSWADAAC